MPRVIGRVLGALCVGALLLPSTATAEPEAALRDVESELEDAREGLEVIEGQQTATLADLEAADARRRELDGRLVALTGQLGVAQGALNQAEAALASTTAQLLATEDRLRATRAELAADQQRLSGRVRTSYIHGPVVPTVALLDVRDAREIGQTLGYLQSVVAADRARVERVTALEREVARQRRDLDALQERQAALRHTAAVERDRVAGLVAAQQAVTGAAAAETQRHQRVLAQLEHDKASYAALVAALEQESARLEAELARIAEEQRRAAEAAAARGAQLVEAPAALGGQLAWPANGRLSSRYGYRTHPITGTRRLHAGIDIAAPAGTPVYAATDGVVVSAGARGGYGNASVVDHGGGMATLYAHQSRLAARRGQRVSRGEVIGYVGSTGFSTGPHLHFEVRLRGRPVDPMPYF